MPSTCKRQYTKKYTSRKSPPFPASACPSGQRRRGNDKLTYVSAPNKNGVKRWVKLTTFVRRKKKPAAAKKASTGGRKKKKPAAAKKASTGSRKKYKAYSAAEAKKAYARVLRASELGKKPHPTTVGRLVAYTNRR
jgi:hypothetical protein